MPDSLLFERAGPIAMLTLNRPDTGNAIDIPLARALLDADPGLQRHPQLIAELERRNAADAAVTADAG